MDAIQNLQDFFRKSSFWTERCLFFTKVQHCIFTNGDFYLLGNKHFRYRKFLSHAELPKHQWIHVAVAFDSQTRRLQLSALLFSV